MTTIRAVFVQSFNGNSNCASFLNSILSYLQNYQIIQESTAKDDKSLLLNSDSNKDNFNLKSFLKKISFCDMQKMQKLVRPNKSLTSISKQNSDYKIVNQKKCFIHALQLINEGPNQSLPNMQDLKTEISEDFYLDHQLESSQNTKMKIRTRSYSFDSSKTI